jgi:hypothetical protein
MNSREKLDEYADIKGLNKNQLLGWSIAADFADWYLGQHQQTVYKISCEWDMGFSDAYSTREKAQKAIDEMDWEKMVDYTLEKVMEYGLVSIEEVNVA